MLQMYIMSIISKMSDQFGRGIFEVDFKNKLSLYKNVERLCDEYNRKHIDLIKIVHTPVTLMVHISNDETAQEATSEEMFENIKILWGSEAFYFKPSRSSGVKGYEYSSIVNMDIHPFSIGLELVKDQFMMIYLNEKDDMHLLQQFIIPHIKRHQQRTRATPNLNESVEMNTSSTARKRK
eukprot:TRINITY_DN6386_c0_g1_i1.p1 TRINITY_DN6386_c0_g1~~TRINITY_DN6386_c0_g1_i1.p1  ORF type:complete len:180 (+),score=10.06 TRINITY_DN6386_c0_g1_i1:250-789(+)